MTSLTVLGTGPVGWDSGTDLFLDVVRRLADVEGLRAVWAGRRSSGAARRAEVDTQLMGVDGLVGWTDEVPDPDGVAVVVLTCRGGADLAGLAGTVAAGVPMVGWAGTVPTGVTAPAAVVDFGDTAGLADVVRRILEETQEPGR